LTLPPAASILARADPGEGVGDHEERDRQLARPEDLERLVERPDEPNGAQDVLVHRDRGRLGRLLGIALELEGAAVGERADRPDVDDLVLDLEAVLEAAQLRDPHVERGLTALEPGRDRAAGTGLLALGAATRGLALARGDPAADARAWLAGPVGRAKVVQFHAFSPVSVSAISSTVTRNRTARTIPRVAGLSVTTLVLPMPCSPSARTVARFRAM